MDFSQHFLSILIWLPVFGGIVLLAIGDGHAEGSGWGGTMRVTALVVSALTFLISLKLYAEFDNSLAEMQFVERVDWIPSLNVFY